MDFAPKTQYDRTIKGAWESAESNPQKHEEKEKNNMKKISRRDFLKASAATSGAALLTACGSSGSSTASTATSTSSAESGPRTVSYWIDLANTSGADVKSMDLRNHLSGWRPYLVAGCRKECLSANAALHLVRNGRCGCG